jgi:hypothetical protein
VRVGELFQEGGADVLCPGRELPGLDVEQLDAVVGERQDTTNGWGGGREGMAGRGVWDGGGSKPKWWSHGVTHCRLI